ncbi:MAG: hypothetical protein OEW02_11615, partial [Myxococcales bacterium]|nr:hypothetical protein [Myxococcales bacterium]
MSRRIGIGSLLLLLHLAAGGAAALPIDPTSSTSVWDAIIYPASTPDPTGDQGTGDREGDIVGDALHAALYTLFDDAGTPSLTDGTLAFRVRMGGDSNPPGFGNFLALGIDAGEDALNDIDLFLGVDG